jgi:hypothetical protein
MSFMSLLVARHTVWIGSKQPKNHCSCR